MYKKLIASTSSYLEEYKDIIIIIIIIIEIIKYYCSTKFIKNHECTTSS
jgi:hypothetical protein